MFCQEPLRYVVTMVYVKNRCCQVVVFNLSHVLSATMKADRDDDVQLEACSVHTRAIDHKADHDDCSPL